VRRDVRFARLVVLVNGIVPVALLAWDALHHSLGVNAVNYALRTTGLLTLIFLLASLVVTPLRRITGWGELIRFRRMLGLYAFFHVCAHFAIFFWFDRAHSVSSTVHEILTRTYLEIGTAALVLMIPLAITSIDSIVTRIGAKRWKALHRATYAIAIGGALHYYLLVKADRRQPLVFAGVLTVLLGYRVVQSIRDRRARRERAYLTIANDSFPGKAANKFFRGELVVSAVREETPDVRTFRLAAKDGGPLPFEYRPGQYLNLTLTIDGKRVNRSYTIASSPTRAGYCEITVKRESEGQASRHLHDSIIAGNALSVSAPAGKFVFTGSEALSVVLIAGGVGITPLMSILRYLTDQKWQGEIVLVVCAKRESDIIFRGELASLVQRFPNIRPVLTLTREEGAWAGARGRISREHLLPHESLILSSPVYVCGPDDMMLATKQLLAELGVPAERILTEAFVSPGVANAPARDDGTAPTAELEPANPDDGPRVFHFARSGKSLEVLPDKTLLEASEEIGVDIPFECRSGVCGQCKTRVLEGRVVMDAEDALSAADRAHRLVLACQARAAGEVRVDA
jgi:ferredoxin-NADP reductase/DMSO/TMAO reductase YedYZ heme-binding membrane subunit